MQSITLIPFEIFNDIWYTYMSGQDDLWRARMVAPAFYTFELSPLNELNRGKFVHSITPLTFEIF